MTTSRERELTEALGLVLRAWAKLHERVDLSAQVDIRSAFLRAHAVLYKDSLDEGLQAQFPQDVPDPTSIEPRA